MNQQTWVTRYASWVVNHPWWMIMLAILVVVAVASGAKHLTFSSSYRVFFSADNPQLMAFDALEKSYTKNDNVMFIITPQAGDIITNETLEVIRQLTTDAWQMPYSTRVDSITNFQHTEANEDDLVVQDLVMEDEPLDQAARDKIRHIALQEPMLVNRLISSRGDVAGVNVTVQLPGIDPVKEVPEVVSFTRELAQQYRDQYPTIEIRLSGAVFMDNAFSEASQDDMAFLMPLSFALMLVTLALMLRGFSGTVATVLVIFGSVAAGMGGGGHLGYPITPPSSVAPPIILTVAIANSVHILVTFLSQMRLGMEKRLAMAESLRINLSPVFLASMTTALGFLSLNFSDVPPFNHLGNMAAIGVIMSFFLSITLLPALMSILPVRVKIDKDGQSGSAVMARFGDFVVRQRRRLMWAMAIIIVILIANIPRNELNDVFVHYFDESIQFRADSDYLDQHLGGLYIIDYSLHANAGSVSDPHFLRELEHFAQWYQAQPEVKHVSTLSDTMKRLNKNMHGDDPDFYRQPESRNLAAQYLLLYEMSLPYGLDLNNQLNVDKSATRFTVSTQILSSNELLALEQRATQWLNDNSTAIATDGGSGPSMMFAHIGKRNIQSMLIGTTLALIMISIILIFALRSFRVGMISLIPNLIPAAMGFGLWGILVGEVGLSLSIVAGMTLGIVVDDTVHFLSKYLRARREKGLNPEDAVRYAFTNVGYALVTTSAVLVSGFLVLAFSNFYLNAGMGMLTAIVIVFALIADFLLLPPLLMKLEEKKR
ncbi:MAG: MMPL family transporter [Gammaproteobacteria bacterium]|nr:MMPL family transporter [Gammaproteobacteria bacterium]MCF6229951.1 MMPL family transporter [Gammaproteobacteria bacterium]